MKTIKNITLLAALILCTFYTNAQIISNPSTTNSFWGTWEWQNGTQIFRVELFEQNHTTKGHFQMLQINQNPNGINTVEVIYTSDKPYNSAMTEHWHPVINAGLELNRSDLLHGRILDNSMNYEDAQYNGLDFWQAWLEMKIIPSNCNNCPITAHWKVEYKDVIPENVIPLNIPTDIILTKTN